MKLNQKLQTFLFLIVFIEVAVPNRNHAAGMMEDLIVDLTGGAICAIAGFVALMKGANPFRFQPPCESAATSKELIEKR